jgi:hypothetical protein
MSDEQPRDDTSGAEYRPSWPPSPKTQIILIALGFGLLNLILIVIAGIALYLR